MPANKWVGPEIPATVIHQFGKYLSTGQCAKPWWDCGNTEMSVAQISASLQNLVGWEGFNTSGSHSKWKTTAKGCVCVWELRDGVGSSDSELNESKTWVSGSPEEMTFKGLRPGGWRICEKTNLVWSWEWLRKDFRAPRSWHVCLSHTTAPAATKDVQ